MFRFKRKGLFYILCIIAVLLSGTAHFTVPKPGPGKMSVTFVDVGQGDSILFSTIDGKTLLVDGGEDDVFDTHLAPFLQINNISYLDYALVTHYHSDHMGGILSLVKAGMVKTLIVPDYEAYAKERLLSAAKDTDTDVIQISEGDSLPQIDENLDISVLHPKAHCNDENQNNSSVVLKAEYFDTSILLTGDIEAEVERELVENHDLEVDILKVAHHGSSTSSLVEFLEEADPTYGVIQAGRNNNYGHPHYETLGNLAENDVLVFRTDLDGSVSFVLDETGIKDIKCQKEGR